MGKPPQDEDDPSGLRQFAKRIDDINGGGAVKPEQLADPGEQPAEAASGEPRVTGDDQPADARRTFFGR